MKPQYPEGKLMQHRLQHGNQMPFAHGFGGAQYFPLRHRVDRVDVIHPRLAVVLALMHSVHANVSGAAFRVRPAALRNRYLARLRVHHTDANLAMRN
jgi:hypothetical protein